MIRTIDECFWGIQNGANIKQSKSSGGFPITRIETIADNKFNRDRVGYAGITDVSSYESYILEDEDLLMSHINSAKYLGRTVLYNRRANEVIIHGMNLLRLRANKEIINPSYAKYLFSGCKFKKQVSRITKKSVNQASFTVGDLKKIKISVPSILEQVQIVEKLDKIAWIIELRQAEIKKAEEIIKARFVEMFGDIKNEEKYSGILLGNICKTISGGTPSTKVTEYYTGDIPWISTVSLGPNHIDGKLAKGYITSLAIKHSATKLIPAGNILFGTRVGVGKSSINDVEMCTNQDIVAIVDVDECKYNKLFIKCVLDSYQAYFDSIKKGATILGVTSDDLKDCLIPNVPINIQNEFVVFVEQVDKSKAVIEKSLKELETLQASLMQKYFS